MTTPVGEFVPRPYPDIVRDLLTTLTGGTVRETAVVPAGEVVALTLLRDRPIRRVSHLQGEIEVERPVRDANGDVVLDANGDPERETVSVPYRFTDADFELFATDPAGGERDAIRFRPTGRRPPVGSTVTVNYYPTQARPAPVTDLNVGSVTRTMLEAVARELAVEELLLENVYRSAFLDTAEGPNLDKVVALVGIRRRPGGVATARVRFTRAGEPAGRITIPTGTVVTDGKGNRYVTVAPLVLEPGEPSREVLTAAVARSTEAVEAGALRRTEVLIAGIGTVGNPGPAVAAAAPETDEQLRLRARGALSVAARGTVEALRWGLRSVDGVKDVAVVEFPNGVPGEIRVDVAYEQDGDDKARAAVEARIKDLRPAGIRVIHATADAAPVTVSVALTLAGSGVPAAELGTVQADLEKRVVAHVGDLPPGGTLRQAQAALAALADPRVVDAEFSFTLGGTAAPSVTAPAGAMLRARQPFHFTVATESGAAGPGTTVQLDILVPLHLAAGVTSAEAESAITLAARSYANGLRGGSRVTVDALIAAVRDESRYAVVRAETSLTAEAAERFLQLADGVGTYDVGPADTVALRSLRVDVREGGA